MHSPVHENDNDKTTHKWPPTPHDRCDRKRQKSDPETTFVCVPFNGRFALEIFVKIDSHVTTSRIAKSRWGFRQIRLPTKSSVACSNSKRSSATARKPLIPVVKSE